MISVYKEVLINLFRWDPYTDKAPRYKEYHVPWRDKLTLLEALRYVYEKYDPISFEYGCRSIMCGRCGVEANGHPVLACITFVEPGRITVEPLKGFPIVKDLVVDRSKVEARALNVRPQLFRAYPPHEEPEILPVESTKDCMELFKCRSCYLCHSACPVVEVAWDRFCGPAIRARNQALRAYDPRDQAERIREVVAEGLWLCTTCLSCKEVCPREIDVPALTIKNLREKAVAKNLPVPSGFEKAAAMAVKTGRILQPEGIPLRDTVSEIIKTNDPVEKVGFFVGCMFDNKLQNAGKAALDVLKLHNVEVIFPKDQVCCGMPMVWSGKSELVAEHFVKTNLAAFERAKVKTVLTICPSCCMTWKEEIPRLAQKILGRKPEFEVLDLHEFLNKKIDQKTDIMKTMKAKVTYHDPCHLRRGMGIYREPRSLVQQIPGVEFVEMREADRCCGGLLRFSEPTLANDLASKKLEFIRESGASIVATTCPLCMDQLSMALRRSKMEGIQVSTVLDLLNRAYQK